MSTIPIVLALLLSLISGSMIGQRTDPVALLRQTLRYWRKIYKTYHEEVTLGYCWADYFLEIRDELSNLSVPLFATGYRTNTITTEATKSQRNQFPGNVMVDATRLRDTRDDRLRGGLPHTMTRSAISNLIHGSSGHRIAAILKIIPREKRMSNDRGIISRNKEKDYKTDIHTRIVQDRTGSCVRKRRHTARNMRGFPLEKTKFMEFSSAREAASPWFINRRHGSKHDDRVISKLRDLERNRHRKILPSVINDLHSFLDDSFKPRIFSLEIPRRKRRKETSDSHRFSFRQRRGRETNSRISPSLYYNLTFGNREIAKDPARHRIPSLNTNSSRTLNVHLQLQQVNLDHDRRSDVIKVLDSRENLSYKPPGAINLQIPRRKELCRDPLLSSRRIFTPRLSFKSRKNAGETVKTTCSRHEVKKSDVGEQDKSRRKRDISTVTTVYSKEIFDRQVLYSHENPGIFYHRMIVPVGSKRNEPNSSQTVRNLHRVGRFMRNSVDFANISAQNSKPNAPLNLRYQRRSYVLQQSSRVSGILAVVVSVLKTLGMFVQVGRQIMNIVESNAILVCTREYLWIKLMRWIDDTLDNNDRKPTLS